MLLVQLPVAQAAFALSNLKVGIESVKNTDIAIDQLSFSLKSLDAENSRSFFSVKKIKPRDDSLPVTELLTIDCKNQHISRDYLQCVNAGIQFNSNALKHVKGKLSFNIHPETAAAEIELSELKLFSGTVSANLSFSNSSLKALLEMKRMQINQSDILKFSPDFPGNINLQTRLSGIVKMSVIKSSNVLDYDLHFDKLAFNNHDGDMLGDNIAFSTAGRLEQTQSIQKIRKIKMAFTAGEILTPYLYSNFSQRPLTINMGQGFYKSDQHWQIGQAVVEDGFFKLKADSVSGHSTQLNNASVQLDASALDKVYAFYFLPVITQELAQLKVEGSANAKLLFDDQKIREYQLSLSDVNIEHMPASGNPKFSFNNLQGNLHASHSAVTTDSFLRFDGANLYDTVEFGSINIPLEASSQSIAISETSRLPVFDGELLVEKFRLDFAGPSTAVEFQGLLTPVSLSLITDALGWPQMSGRISGIIPAIFYEQRNAKIDGTLLIRVFDGNILLKDVEASHLLSSWPVLRTDVEINDIDLEQLTQTFEFGRITGNVDGQISGLVLENWRPSQFDAVFRTSENSGRKRISQKAVNNISNLGGAGVAGALSRTFMRFFEDFGYDELGFSCRLRKGVCEMNGVADANQGYYLVKGGGIPRIDVIGHNRKTDWNILLERLISVTEAGTPSIQ